MAGVVVVFLALLALVALVVGGLGTTTTTTTTGGSGSGVAERRESAPMEAIDAALHEGRGAVINKFESVGFSLFGINFGGSSYEVHVGLVAPPECIEQDDRGVEEVVTLGACGELPASGQVSGGGTTMDQVMWVIVRVETSRECFEVVGEGDTWPSEAVECR